MYVSLFPLQKYIILFMMKTLNRKRIVSLHHQICIQTRGFGVQFACERQFFSLFFLFVAELSRCRNMKVKKVRKKIQRTNIRRIFASRKQKTGSHSATEKSSLEQNQLSLLKIKPNVQQLED